MNANELADELEDCEPYNVKDTYLLQAAAAMLRQFGLAESIIKQQQLEIEALKKENSDMNRRLLGWDIYMNNDEYELRKELIEFRHILKDFNKSGWLYKFGDRFCTWLENKLRKAQEK